jgi:Arm DNA-binding domain
MWAMIYFSERSNIQMGDESSGKSGGRHKRDTLTPVSIKHLAPGRHPDGGGLYVLVDDLGIDPDTGKPVAGARRFVVRVVRRRTSHDGKPAKGTRHDITLGSVNAISLKDAREDAKALVAAAIRGEDVVALNRMKRRPAADAESAHINTFAAIAKLYHSGRENTGAWTNAKHAAQWMAVQSGTRKRRRRADCANAYG